MIFYLTGMSGVGKTVVGAKAAAAAKWGFIDIDRVIEKKAKQPISVIFEKCGETAFRDLEHEVIKEISIMTGNYIVSTGGGAVIQDRNYNIMKKEQIILLHRSAENIWQTLDLANRPVLKDKGYEHFLALYESRMPIYQERAYLQLEGTQDQMIKKLLKYCLDSENV